MMIFNPSQCKEEKFLKQKICMFVYGACTDYRIKTEQQILQKNPQSI